MSLYSKISTILILLISASFLFCCKARQQSPFSQALDLIQNGDVTNLEKIIISNPSLIKMKDDFDDRTLLHVVFSRGFFDDEVIKMSELLIAAGSDIDSTDDRGMTPAHCAAYYGNGGGKP